MHPIDIPRPPVPPFTVLADLDPCAAEPCRFDAPNPDAAAQITAQLLTRDPFCRARWGPTASPDGNPWPVHVFLRDRSDPDASTATVHVSLLVAGDNVGPYLLTCCGNTIVRSAADFTQRGHPCQHCLTYWRLAQDQIHPDEDDVNVAGGHWAPIDHQLLARVLTALRRLPTSSDATRSDRV